jgi:hypothetical protein
MINGEVEAQNAPDVSSITQSAGVEMDHVQRVWCGRPLGSSLSCLGIDRSFDLGFTS